MINIIVVDCISLLALVNFAVCRVVYGYIYIYICYYTILYYTIL